MILRLVAVDLKAVSRSLFKLVSFLENRLSGCITQRDEVIYILCSHFVESGSPLVCFLVSQEFSHEIFLDVSFLNFYLGGVKKLEK